MCDGLHHSSSKEKQSGYNIFNLNTYIRDSFQMTTRYTIINDNKRDILRCNKFTLFVSYRFSNTSFDVTV